MFATYGFVNTENRIVSLNGQFGRPLVEDEVTLVTNISIFESESRCIL